MKKYLAAGGVAVVAAAFAASAASFNVADSFLASGQGDVEACQDNITYDWRLGDFVEGDGLGDVEFKSVLLRGTTDCANLDATVQLVDGDGKALGKSHTRRLPGNGATDFFSYHLGVDGIQGIEGINVLIQTP